MEERSRVRFNPATMEIEIEGSEEFVRTYFGKVQKLLLSLAGGREAKPKPPKAHGMRGKMKKASGSKKSPKRPVKGALSETVVNLIRNSAKGITTAALKEKTGLAENQIWSIVYRAEKQGKIKKTKRGIYTAA